jgi:flagellar protein FliO/FliZ
MSRKFLFFILFFAQLGFAVEVTTAISEDQIPLKIEQQVRASDTSANSTKMVLSLAVVGLMLGAAYYFIRKYGIANKIPAKSNMQIKVLSQHYLGPKKSLVIVRVAGESILIGVTENNISMIKALSLLDDELPQVLPKNFEDSLNQTSQRADQNDEVDDDFSFSGLKLSVSEKLKSMRSFQ